jgi:hypothetical protein
VILPGHAGADAVLHQPGQAGEPRHGGI